MTVDRGVPLLSSNAVAARQRRTAQRPMNGLSLPAARIRDLSIEVWREDRAVEIIGESPPMLALLKRLEKIAAYREPVLIVGESGVGKEFMAQAVYLLSGRAPKPFVSVNCPQYQEGNLTVSELFGHKKGSFTGAVADRKGCFETAGAGVIFLDEIGDLHMSAQMMLLRALATGEFQPLGADTSRRVRARVVAATNRTLNQLAVEKHFRRDLLFRLRCFLLEVPPLRDRGDDWRLLADYSLRKLHQRYGVKKRFSRSSLNLLEECTWPGNVRELIGLTTTAYALSDRPVIEPQYFVEYLRQGQSAQASRVDRLFRQLTVHQGNFWEIVKQPFLERDLNRREVQRLIAQGLRRSRGSYRDLLDLWNIPPSQYQRFMDFLRHHRLKPITYEDTEA